MKQEVSNKITMYNFIMTLCIVIYHFEFKVKTTTHWTKGILFVFNRIIEGLGTLAMGIFFMVSGFLLYNKANTIKDVLKKMKSRVFSLFIPFLVWNLITFIFRFEFTGIKDFLYGFFCKPYNGAIWYLLGLTFLMLFSPIIIRLKKNPKLCLFVFIGVLILTECLGNFGHNMHWYKVFTDNVWYFGNILAYLPIYFVGVYAGMFCADILLNEKYNVNKVRNIATLLFVLTFMAMCIYPVYKLYIICTIAFWFCVPAKIFKNKPSQVFNVSFLIYVMHIPFLIRLSNLIMLTFIGTNNVLPIVKLLGKICGTIIVWMSAIVYDWVIKNLFGNKVYRILTGGRGT